MSSKVTKHLSFVLYTACLCSICMLFCNCNSSFYQKDLNHAEDLLYKDPDSVLYLLDDIPVEELNSLEWSQYIFIKTRVSGIKSLEITWPDEMHRAALIYETSARPFDAQRAGDFYYFSGCVYKGCDMVPAAIVEWLRAVELYEQAGAPSIRQHSAYEYLQSSFRQQLLHSEAEKYSFKMLETARCIKDTSRMIRSIEAVTNSVYQKWSLDSTLSLVLEELQMAKATGRPSNLCLAYNSLAFLYERVDSIETAGLYADSALAYSTSYTAYQTIGMIRRKQGRIAEAVELFIKAYPTALYAGKYWMGQFLNEISKTEPGYEYLSSYADSVIVYKAQFDHEEKSDSIQIAIAQYQAQRKSEEFHQMLKSIGVAVAALVVIFLLLYGWKTWRTKLRIEHLQKLLQEEKAKMLVNEESPDPVERLRQRRESLRLHCELFYTTETYRDLKLLRELRAGQMVNASKRDELIHLVLAAFYDPIRPMLEGDQFSHEDLFLCLMTYMKFRSREIAACLGVSDDAVRQRKRRLKPKLEGGEFDLFFVE